MIDSQLLTDFAGNIATYCCMVGMLVLPMLAIGAIILGIFKIRG